VSSVKGNERAFLSQQGGLRVSRESYIKSQTESTGARVSGEKKSKEVDYIQNLQGLSKLTVSVRENEEGGLLLGQDKR